MNKLKGTSIFLLFVFILFLLGYGLLQLSKSRTFQFFGGLTEHVAIKEKVVALTFDDAPTEYTESVLKTLQEGHIKATFFVIGSNLEAYPQIGKAIATQGSEIGNHSYSHQRFLLKSQSFIDEEIQKTNNLIRQTGYKGEILFRPPNGKKFIGLPWYLHQHNIKTIMWDVEPDTYAGDGSEKTGSLTSNFIVDYTLQHTKPGSIILLHPFCKSCSADRDAISKIIVGLRKKGYRFVTVSELLTYDRK
jgi:chitin deacetylase